MQPYNSSGTLALYRVNIILKYAYVCVEVYICVCTCICLRILDNVHYAIALIFKILIHASEHTVKWFLV